MMKGIMEFLANKSDLDSQTFLDRYVLLLIPMLNPDGVYRGHYRLDALGYDPNRLTLPIDSRVYNRLYKKNKFPA
jgi:murein tripeptide amidase MpaA